MRRDEQRRSSIEQVASENDLLKVPEEIGLRPSSVLMFDRLVFVEGPSDEAILREFGRKLNADFTLRNCAFVQTGGSANFNHYAAKSTVGLLSRRQIRMWFVVDRDERDDADLQRLVERLEDRAQLVPLRCRELENYLLKPRCLTEVISKRVGSAVAPPAVEVVAATLDEIAETLKERVIELRVIRRLLKPVFPDRHAGSVKERITSATKSLQDRLEAVHAETSRVEREMETEWAAKKLEIAPGSLVLEALFGRFGLKYSKQADGIQIAECMHESELDQDLLKLIHEVTL